jgi:hypothetical protein
MATDEDERRLLAPLAAEAERHREAFLRVIDAEPDRWWRADELRDAAGAHGPMAMYALCRLTNPEYDDTLEMNPGMLIRRRRVGRGREGAVIATQIGRWRMEQSDEGVWLVFGDSKYPHDPPRPASDFEVALNEHLRIADEALGWIGRFTSDRGDARMMDPGQARAHIHRRATSAVAGREQ